ncbi:MAG: tRNA (adenosine(37)-N6)-threonylcarbamoyltransferase complex ATPase subunit type 1 TsaE [Fimbriimonadaceae bacterium]|nr:tRNA (adenosine(37)-N6)-threonylcarbamoyltransferase complex ATPase subunit type 1 TsaE [Fimbriimonadaceae bacterium]
MTEVHPQSDAEMRALAAEWSRTWRIGDLVLLRGELGAGKTTFVRGVLEGLGYVGPVRSPTFNLIQVFETSPPIMHADLYRLKDATGVGLEDYLDTHLCFVEWPDRLGTLLDPSAAWRVEIEFEGKGRLVRIIPPKN